MKYGSLIIEKKDCEDFYRHWLAGYAVEDLALKHMMACQDENMADAVVKDLADMPDDIIRLYSRVMVTSAPGWDKTFQLVPPHERDIKRDQLSVQSALGASVNGRVKGNLIRFDTPIGVIPLRIKKVKQRTIKEFIPDVTSGRHLPERQSDSYSIAEAELV